MDRQEAVIRLVDVFRRYGYEGASMAKLSEVTGLGKSSLYHHFPGGKAEMAAAVLDYLGTGLETKILAPLRLPGDPCDRIRAMNAEVARFYQQGQQACLLALLSFGEAHDLFAEDVRQAFMNWIRALAAVVMEAGFSEEIAVQRAEDAILQIQGAIVLAHGLGDSQPFKRVLERLPEQLLLSDSEFDSATCN